MAKRNTLCKPNLQLQQARLHNKTEKMEKPSVLYLHLFEETSKVSPFFLPLGW